MSQRIHQSFFFFFFRPPTLTLRLLGSLLRGVNILLLSLSLCHSPFLLPATSSFTTKEHLSNFACCLEWYQENNKTQDQETYAHVDKSVLTRTAGFKKKKRTNKFLWGILLQRYHFFTPLGKEGSFIFSTWWPNRGRVSRSRIGSARTSTIKRRSGIMFEGHVQRRRTERKLHIKPCRPAIAATVAV